MSDENKVNDKPAESVRPVKDNKAELRKKLVDAKKSGDFVAAAKFKEAILGKKK
jgi:hypothetical protein